MDILIRRASAIDCQTIAEIGRVAVKEAHLASCSESDMDEYLVAHYNKAAIMNELNDSANIYHVIFCNGQPVGFSKIVLNCSHGNIKEGNVTKLDRIYLLKEFHGLGLGKKILDHNISLSIKKGQCGMWLFTWVGNERAIGFYKRNGFTVIGTHQFKVSDTQNNLDHHMFLVYGR